MSNSDQLHIYLPITQDYKFPLR